MSIRSNVDRGEFDQRITIQAPVEERTSSGNMESTWSTVVECWARMDATTAKERVVAGQQYQVNAYTCWIRADIVSRFQIKARMRVLWRGEPYDIQDIPDNTLRGRKTALFLIGGLSAEGQ